MVTAAYYLLNRVSSIGYPGDIGGGLILLAGWILTFAGAFLMTRRIG